MRVRYIGKTLKPLELTLNNMFTSTPYLINGKIYVVVSDNQESNYYIVIDEKGKKQVVYKSLCVKVGE